MRKIEPYIVEHPTRGTLKFFVSENEFGFSTTGMRNDPEKTRQFDTLQEATGVMGRLPERIRKDCKVLQYDAETFSYINMYPGRR